MTFRRIVPRVLLAAILWGGLSNAAHAQEFSGPAKRDWVLSVVITILLAAGPLYLCAAPTGREEYKEELKNPLMAKGADH
ncbi:MAG TPA: hypothetical protein VGE52_09775 [Pirellulales bacterium]